MISTNDFRNGLTIELDGDLFIIVEFQHVKPGKGSAFVRSKLKNLKTGYTLEKTFRAAEKVTRAHIDRREMQFLYKQDTEFVFMDNQSYDQINLSEEQIGDNKFWIKDGSTIHVLFHNENAIGIEVSNFMDLKITHTEPGFKGDTATGGTKPATLETGAVVQVPLFVNIDDVVQVDTRTSTYLKRV
ncbi:MAG: elongation factor P [Armatimonadota bacterium]